MSISFGGQEAFERHYCVLHRILVIFTLPHFLLHHGNLHGADDGPGEGVPMARTICDHCISGEGSVQRLKEQNEEKVSVEQ